MIKVENLHKTYGKNEVLKGISTEIKEKEVIAAAKALPGPRRASLPPRMKPEDMTLELAVKLLELPRELGNDPVTHEPVIANIGRFGPYVGRNRDFRSIKKPLDPYTITLDQAVTLLNSPKSLPKGVELLRTVGIHPKTKKEIQILKSKSGNFIRQGMKRIYIPDRTDPMEISLDEVVALITMASADKKRK